MALPKLEYNILNDSKLLDDISNAFIKKFKTDKNYYIYDVNSNEFFNVDEIAYSIFKDPDDDYRLDITDFIIKYGINNVLNSLLEIKKYREQFNIFKTNRPNIGIPYSEEQLFNVYYGVRERLTLTVTENYNLRCKYCVYSGIYNNRRQHTKKDMTWETAKLALDDFIRNSFSSRKRTIGFYGGEPLLNYNLIKKCVKYLQRIDDTISFHITTNGILLNNEILDFINNNNIYHPKFKWS